MRLTRLSVELLTAGGAQMAGAELEAKGLAAMGVVGIPDFSSSS